MQTCRFTTISDEKDNLFISVYHELYMKKYVQQSSLSNELGTFIDENGGYDFPAIAQKFILDRSETAMFMQVCFWL